jgi:hypothetical protein
MAKPAKTPNIDLTDKIAIKFVKDILERFEAIESAKGVYMNRAQRERQGMQTIYETMSARGISQKSAKTNIRIIRLLQKAKALIADLAEDDAKTAKALAKAQRDKQQLMLWSDLPAQAKPKKAKGDNVLPFEINDDQEVVAAE